MARDDGESAASSQSKRADSSDDSDSRSSNSDQGARPDHHHSHRAKQQKQHVVGVGGRLHTRVPSSRALHKHPNSSSSAKLNRRAISREASPERQAHPGPAHTHRRAQSDVKLTRDPSHTNLKKNSSQSSLKRNRSNGDVARRSRSFDKLKLTAAHPGSGRGKATAKSQVHFDLGTDGQDDDSEWVDASNSASPQLARRGPPAIRPAEAAGADDDEAPPAMSTPDRETSQRKEYLTSRLLLRTPSQGLPPQMSREMASVPPSQHSPDSPGPESSTLFGTPRTGTLPGSAADELTSRFVGVPGSGLTSEGSFYHPSRGGSRGREGGPRRPRSMVSLAQESSHRDPDATDDDESALAPRAPRRPAAPPAEKSRTQQKLNLQRASSVIEPGQAVTGGAGVVGASPLIGVVGPGYDGSSSRDPRVGKLLERTGMEYLVVRRYQNPVARSLSRLSRLPGSGKHQPIPRNGSLNGKRTADTGRVAAGHSRNPSLLDRDAHGRRPVTPRRTHSIRTNDAGSSYDPDDDGARMHDRLSGSSLVGGEDEDGTVALLRNLWDKSMDLSASQD